MTGNNSKAKTSVSGKKTKLKNNKSAPGKLADIKDKLVDPFDRIDILFDSNNDRIINSLKDFGKNFTAKRKPRKTKKKTFIISSK